MLVTNEYTGNLIIQHLLEVVLCPVDTQVDGCINTVGRAASSLGNPIASAIQEAACADVVLAASGHHLKCFW